MAWYPVNSNLGGKAPELIWTNPSPTSNFDAQKVSIDLSKYDGFIIEYNIDNISPYVVSRVYYKMTENVSPTSGWNIGSGAANSSTAFGRPITSFDNTGITFGNAVCRNQVENAWLIPYKIYGVTAQNVDLGGVAFKEMMVFNSVSTYIKETYVNYDTNTVTSNYSTNNTISTLNGTSMKMESDSSVDGVKITATKKGTYYVLKGDNSTTMTPNVVLVTTENTVVAQFSRYSNVNMVIKIG